MVRTVKGRQHTHVVCSFDTPIVEMVTNLNAPIIEMNLIVQYRFQSSVWSGCGRHATCVHVCIAQASLHVYLYTGLHVHVHVRKAKSPTSHTCQKKQHAAYNVSLYALDTLHTYRFSSLRKAPLSPEFFHNYLTDYLINYTIGFIIHVNYTIDYTIITSSPQKSKLLLGIQ
jgi:hypothetical protein